MDKGPFEDTDTDGPQVTDDPLPAVDESADSPQAQEFEEFPPLEEGPPPRPVAQMPDPSVAEQSQVPQAVIQQQDILPAGGQQQVPPAAVQQPIPQRAPEMQQPDMRPPTPTQPFSVVGFTDEPRDTQPLESMGRPPTVPLGAAFSFDQQPLTFARSHSASSGIGGQHAPLWDTVERELRQNTLTDFLRRMFDTLNNHQRIMMEIKDVAIKCSNEIKGLKDRQTALEDTVNGLQTAQQVTEVAKVAASDAVSDISNRLERVEDDIGMQKEEIIRMDNTDQNDRQSLRQIVDRLAAMHNKSVHLSDRRELLAKRRTAWLLREDISIRPLLLLGPFFRKWIKSVEQPMRLIRQKYLTLAVNFTKCKQFNRKERQLRFMHTKNTPLLSLYWGKMIRFLKLIEEEREELVKVAKMIEEIGRKNILERYLKKLMGKRNIRVQMKKKAEICEIRDQQFQRALLGSYFAKLSAYKQWEQHKRRQIKQSEDLRDRSFAIIRRKYMSKWARVIAMIRRGLEREAISRALLTKNAQLVRRDFYATLYRYRELRRSVRDKEEQDLRTAELHRRNDNLGTQIDVGLKTLSNTNSVLNKLVDRLIAVDQQLDTLEKDKVSRRELSFITDPGRHPEIEEPPPPSPRRMTSRDPRTSVSPPMDPGTVGQYMPSVLESGERQRRLEEEMELERAEEARHAVELEQRTAELNSIARNIGSMMADTRQQQQQHQHHQPPPNIAMPPQRPLMGGINHNLVTPPMQRQSTIGTPSTEVWILIYLIRVVFFVSFHTKNIQTGVWYG